MGEELGKMSLEERCRVSSEMFDAIDENHTATIDFKEFFSFYEDHLHKLVYEEDFANYNPKIKSPQLTKWRKTINGTFICWINESVAFMQEKVDFEPWIHFSSYVHIYIYIYLFMNIIPFCFFRLLKTTLSTTHMTATVMQMPPQTRQRRKMRCMFQS